MAMHCSQAAESQFGPITANCTPRFDFTLLFEETILYILPLVIAFCLSVARVTLLLKQKAVAPGGRLVIAKIFGYISSAALQCVFLVVVTTTESIRTAATIPASVVGIIIYPVLAIQSYFEHRYASRPPTTLILLFLVTIPMNVVRCRTLYLTSMNLAPLIVFSIFSAFSVGILGMESWNKRRVIYSTELPTATEETSNIIGRTFISWIYPLFRRGWATPLGVEDLLPIDRYMLINRLEDVTETPEWHSQPGKQILLGAVFKSHASLLWQPVLPRLCYLALSFAQPFLVKRATSYVEEQTQTRNYKIGGGLIAAYFLVYVGIAAMYTMYQQKAVRLATAIRNSLMSAISQQVLCLDLAAAQTTSAPSLLSANVNSIQMGFRALHDTWSSFVGTVIALWLLSSELGVSVAPTAVLSFLLIVASLFLSLRAGPRQKVWFDAVGRRVAATSAILMNMKAVKLMGCKKYVKDMLNAARKDEIKRSQSFRIFLIMTTTLSYASTALAPAFALGVHILITRSRNSTGVLLTSSTAFSSLTLLSILTSNMTVGIQAVLSFFTMISCLQRIQAFLTQESRKDIRLPLTPSKEHKELQSPGPYALAAPNEFKIDSEDLAFKLEQVSVKYEGKSATTLSDITVDIPKSGIVLLVGPTGSGKSTLLRVLLGEMCHSSGSVSTSTRRIAYAAQNPWIMNTTVRENIIGEEPFDAARYQLTLQACGLAPHMAHFSKGDNTRCGVNGSALSGGQKKRVAMARAAYAGSPVTILDDSLSGLDSKIQSHILSSLFDESSPLNLKSTVVILSTTNPDYVRFADTTIHLDSDGRQVEMRPYSSNESSTRLSLDESLVERSSTEEDTPPPSKQRQTSQDNKATSQRNGSYKYYVRMVGPWQTAVFVLLCASFVVGLSYPQIFLRSWALFDGQRQRSTLPAFLGVFFGLAFAALAFYVAATLYFMLDMATRSSRNFHRVVLDVTLGAPLHVLNATNSGVIINRFSQDLQQIDRPLPMNLIASTVALLQVISQVAIIIVVSPWSGIAVPGIGLAIGIVQVVYLRTSRRLRMLELDVLGPLFSHLTEAMQGLATIRSLKWEGMFRTRCLNEVKGAQAPFYLLLQAQNTLNLVLDLITAATAVVVISIGVGVSSTSGGLGLALFSVVIFGQSVKTFVQTWTMLEIALGAVGRVRDYEDSAILESDDGDHSSSNWPSRGAIDIRHLSVTYPSSSTGAITDLNLQIKAGSKVGICGHSGSGKSTLIASLLRLIDYDKGTICIDGVDITSLKRDDVRSSLAVLPQDPLLLRTSVRANLNLCTSANDAEMWESLKAVGIDALVQQKGGLEAVVSEDTMSDGELRLLCIARLMLQRCPLLLLDEPTSSLDLKIQESVLREVRMAFEHSTILCIAHRLDTIVDFDVVIVMEQGKLIEIGHPTDLLRTRDSAFAALYHKYMDKSK